MALKKYLHPIEYSFYVWVQSIKEEYEPVGVDYFLIFVKNVCRFNGVKWMKRGYLEKRILKEIPGISKGLLDERLSIFYLCIDFHKTQPYPKGIFEANGNIPASTYILMDCKKGSFIEEIQSLAQE